MRTFTIFQPQEHEIIAAPAVSEKLFIPQTLAHFRCSIAGIRIASKSSVVIAGCVRDVNTDVFDRNIKRLEIIGSKFKNYKIVLFENDSSIKFRTLLNNIKVKNDNISIISKTLGIPKLGVGRDYRRIYLLSQFRNNYFNIIKDELSDFDYVIVIDNDIQSFRLDGVFNSLGQSNWDMIGSNGIQIEGKANSELYYDTYALIEENMKTYPTGQNIPAFPINCNKMHRVFSCFGGIGIYKMAAFLSGEEYGPIYVDGNLCADHCGLAMRMALAGHNKVYINQNMVVMR